MGDVVKAIDDYYEIYCNSLNLEEIDKIDEAKVILFKNTDCLSNKQFEEILKIKRNIVLEITSDKFKDYFFNDLSENIILDFLINDISKEFNFSLVKAKKQAHIYLLKENLDKVMDYIKFLDDNDFYQVRLIYALPYYDLSQVPQIKEIQNLLKETIFYVLNKTNLYIYLENMPYCVLPYFEKYFQRYDLSLPTSKAGICDSCALSEICYGFYDIYFKNFSDFVFLPIPGKKVLSFSELIPDRSPFFDNPKIFGKQIDDPFSRKI